MKTEDLIKKLENTELPEIEIASHQASLRMALLNSDYFKKPSFPEVFRRSLTFAIPSLAVLIILGITVIQPKLTEAKVLGIAKNNPEIKRLIEENNMVLGQVKVKDGKAFVLLSGQKKESSRGIQVQKIKNSSENMEGAIVEVDIDKEEVAQIKSINSEDIAPLKDNEKESAKEIAGKEEVVNNLIPKEAKIEKILPTLPQRIRLIEKNNKFEATSSERDGKKEALVQYILDGKKWSVRVNLDEKKVEEIEYSSDNNKGRD